MHYQNVREARFLDRPNRFIAHVELNGAVETVHVKNTGRCRELLVPGCTVYLEKGTNPNVWKGQPSEKKDGPMSFEDMMDRFKKVSDEKMTDLKKSSDSKRSGGYSRRGGGRQ